ncbi:MAG: hypothetical protein ACRDWA_13685 [Acidimicrobiia bacterium]
MKAGSTEQSEPFSAGEEPCGVAVSHYGTVFVTDNIFNPNAE